MVCFDDGTANRETDAHAVLLCTVERLEEPISNIRRESHPAVFRREANTIVTFRRGFDEQLPWPIFNLPHRINCIANEIHDHLLNLYSVTLDRQEIFCKVLLQDHPIPPQFTRHECNHLTRCLIQIDYFGHISLSLKERPQAHDDIGKPDFRLELSGEPCRAHL